MNHSTRGTFLFIPSLAHHISVCQNGFVALLRVCEFSCKFLSNPLWEHSVSSPSKTRINFCLLEFCFEGQKTRVMFSCRNCHPHILILSIKHEILQTFMQIVQLDTFLPELFFFFKKCNVGYQIATVKVAGKFECEHI